MGQGGSEPGPWRDELTARDGEDTHGDVTRDFSSQWKHGARFTVRAARSLFLAGTAAASPPLLPALVTVPQRALCFPRHTLLSWFLCQHAHPAHLLFVHSLVPLLIQQIFIKYLLCARHCLWW